MSRENISENEIKLVKEYQLKKDNKIALYFYKKFSKDLVNIIYYRINNKFSSIPIERNDLCYLVWNGIKQALLEFDETKGVSLFNYFVQKSYQKGLREAMKFLTNGQIMLNRASSLEEIIYSNKYVWEKNATQPVFQTKQEKVDEIVLEISQKMSKYSVKKIKKIIYWRSLGFSLKDISKKTKINLSEVKNLFRLIKKVGEKIYKL